MSTATYIINMGASYSGEVNFLVYGAWKISTFRLILFYSIVMHFPHLTTAPRTMGFVYTTTMVLKDVKSSFSNVDHAKRGNGAASTKQNTTYHCQKHTINNKSNIINKATQCLVVLFN